MPSSPINSETEILKENLNIHKQIYEMIAKQVTTKANRDALDLMNLSIQKKIGKAVKDKTTEEYRSFKLQGGINEQLKKINDKLAAGVFSRRDWVAAEKKIFELQRDYIRENQAAQNAQALSSAAIMLANKSGLGKMVEFSKEINSLWKSTESVAVRFVIITAKILSDIVDIFNQLDVSAMEFRKELGFTRKFTGDIDTMARSVAVEFAKIGVSGKDAYDAVVGISTQLFSSLSITPDLVKNISIMSAQLGISAYSTAELYRNLGIAGRSSASAQKDTVLFATALSEAAGTPLKDVMSDISTATKTAYQFITRSSVAMIKTAVEARRMGTSIESATKTAGGLLNFTQNVKDEMEASVLLGKSMNLQKARELAYNKDIRGLNKEILNIIKETDFENLDPFQQKAVAAALGKEAGELANMAQAERERQNMLKAMTPEQKKQYDLYRQMEESSANQVKDYAKIAEETLRQEGNQTRIKNIANSWQSIMMRLSEKFLPIIDVTLKFIADHFDTILGMATGTFAIIKFIVPLVRAIVADIKLMSVYASKILPLFTRISAVLKPVGAFFKSIITPIINFGKLIISPFVKLFGWLGKIFPSVAKLFAGLKTLVPIAGWIGRIGIFFGKWLTPIGWVITAIMFIVNLFKRFSGISKELDGTWKGVGKAIWFGIKAVALAIYDTLLGPFVDAAKWIWKKLCGKSPSELGLGIVEGIKAVGGMLLNALLFPYKAAWGSIKQIGAYISDLFGSKLGSNILNGIKTVSGAILDALLFPYKMAWELIKKIPFVSKMFGNKDIGVNVTPEARATANAERAKPEVDVKRVSRESDNTTTVTDVLAKKITEIVDAINSLRTDMKNGVLTANVYLDSQKLDSNMARRMTFTGNLV